MSIPAVAFFALGCLIAHAQAADPESFIVARAGNLPIILTAPHGGQQAVSARARTRGVTTMDAGTLELTLAVAERLSAVAGAEPYVVAARFSRRFIDANRTEAEAFDDPDARPVYVAYHTRIRAFVAEVKEKFPAGALLLDIHGQGDDPDVVHRGTRNGATVVRLINRHGADALIGPNSVLGQLHIKGHRVFPPNTPAGEPPEDRRYNGGHTVFTYGSNTGEGIDAMQLELGRNMRTRSDFVNDLAGAIAVFYKAYLMAAPPVK